MKLSDYASLRNELAEMRSSYDRLAYRAGCVVADYENRGTDAGAERLEHAVANLEVELKNGARS